MEPESSHSFDRSKIPNAFLLRRLHSIAGMGLVIYLFYHLLVNSQAGFFFKDEGHHFIRMVNALEQMPYLPVVEIFFIGLPLVIHTIWGIIYLRQAKMNSFPGTLSEPRLPQYKKNRAFSWQRITSWILLFGITAHIVHMRFVASPKELTESHYVVQVNDNEKMKEAAKILKMEVKKENSHLVAYSEDPGKGFLMMLRNSFSNLYMSVAYSLLVIFTSYHAFNGVWTFLITWGATMTQRSQKYARVFVNIFMGIVIFFGLFAIWGTYVNVF